MTDKDEFLYPRSRYYGQVKPENLIFNANLQKFAQQIGYIVSLQTGGKLSPEEAYQQIEALWQQLKLSKKQLRIGKNPLPTDEGRQEEWTTYIPLTGEVSGFCPIKLTKGTYQYAWASLVAGDAKNFLVGLKQAMSEMF